MRDEQAPLWRVGLRGLGQGAAGGFLASLLLLWLCNSDLWPLSTVFDWQSVIGYTVIAGWIRGLSVVLTEHKRRKAATKEAGQVASGSTERAATDEAS
ncbi:hypothetical protein ACFYSC_17595 [Streptosporangium sp. NPDC004379]|uniref:hypothetical protein n=1 Tax=Streptosporangium sp. NPDC004379 TaxID=3366189 RepID=UPI0036927934